MLKKGFKNLSIGLLIMAISSTVVAASEGSLVDDDLGITPAIDPRKVLSTLERTLTREAVDFSEELFTKRAKTVEGLLTEYKGRDDQKQEKILTAVIVGAVKRLTKGSDKIWVTARLANFLLGNRLHPATYGWLDDDVEILAYLRNPATQSVTDKSSLIYQLTQKFINGAANFTKTYAFYDQFTLIQHSFDASEVFGDISQRVLPSAVDIFNEAVISNWGDPIVIQKEGSAGIKTSDETSSITAVSTTSTSYSSAFSFQSQNVVILPGPTSPANFSTALYDYPASKDKKDAKTSMQNALDFYKTQQCSRQQMLAFAFKDILDCLATNMADVSRLAHWKVARLAYFLLANRLLPPTHQWLCAVSSTTDGELENNNTRLKYLMGENGMLQSAMDHLLQSELSVPENITESSLTRIHSLAIKFKRGAEGYMEARAGFRYLAKKQRDLDTSGTFGDTRQMPSVLTIFGASMNSKKTMYQVDLKTTQTDEVHVGDEADRKKPSSTYFSSSYLIPVGVAVVGGVAACWFYKDILKETIDSFRASLKGK